MWYRNLSFFLNFDYCSRCDLSVSIVMFKYGIFFTFVFLRISPLPSSVNSSLKQLHFSQLEILYVRVYFKAPFPGFGQSSHTAAEFHWPKKVLCLNSSPSPLPAHCVHTAAEAAGVCVCSHERPWFGGSNCDPLFCWSLLFFHLTPAVCWLPLCLWHVNAGSLISSSGESALASS